MSSSTSSTPPATSLVTTPETATGTNPTATTPQTQTKPIKLRAACNHCFSAKVRCDGNKEGCRRCVEKKLPCVYSESRVGKVVGKRRKRPIDDSIGTITSQSWIVHNSVPIHSVPSPAATHTSVDSSKRQCSLGPAWSSHNVGDDQGFLNFEETTESLGTLEMADQRSYSVASDLSFFSSNGLPTPGLSPPQFTRYTSPAYLEQRPISRQSSCPIDPAKLHPRSYSVLSGTVDQSVDDEETICIKLLAHLKKHVVNDLQTREAQIELLSKSSAAVRRLLRSRTIRSDYSCHLLLSNIINHLVRVCERLSQGNHDELQFMNEQFHFEGMPGFFDTPVPESNIPLDQELTNGLIQEVAGFTTIVGDFLKKKPIYGFQHLGRHEMFHVKLEQRLRNATTVLQG